jgi:hypothetical protein
MIIRQRSGRRRRINTASRSERLGRGGGARVVAVSVATAPTALRSAIRTRPRPIPVATGGIGPTGIRVRHE